MLGVGGWVLLLFFIFMFCIGGTHKVTSHAVLFVDRTVNGQVYVTLGQKQLTHWCIKTGQLECEGFE